MNRTPMTDRLIEAMADVYLSTGNPPTRLYVDQDTWADLRIEVQTALRGQAKEPTHVQGLQVFTVDSRDGKPHFHVC